MNYWQPIVCSETLSLKQVKHGVKDFVKFCATLPWGPIEKSQPGRYKKTKVGNCCSRGLSRQGKGVFLLAMGKWGVCWHYKMVSANCNAEGPGRMKGKE